MRPGKSSDPVNWGTLNRGSTVDEIWKSIPIFNEPISHDVKAPYTFFSQGFLAMTRTIILFSESFDRAFGEILPN